MLHEKSAEFVVPNESHLKRMAVVTQSCRRRLGRNEPDTTFNFKKFLKLKVVSGTARVRENRLPSGVWGWSSNITSHKIPPVKSGESGVPEAPAFVQDLR